MNKIDINKFPKIPTVNFVGCGKLGKTIGYLLTQKKLVKVQDIYNTSAKTNKHAINFIGSGNKCTNLNKISSAHIYFISTPDDEIKEVCKKIVQSKPRESNSIFVHFSGSLTSDALKSAQKSGHHVCSLHPIKSFADPQENINNFSETYCAFEGSEFAFKILNKMFSKIGAQIFKIQKDNKLIYHAAAVFGSNYLIPIANYSLQCYENAGVEAKLAKKIIISLMEGTIKNIALSKNITDALTGPLQRGDTETIKKHVKALKSISALEKYYKILGEMTLKITKHDLKIKKLIQKIL